MLVKNLFKSTRFSSTVVLEVAHLQKCTRFKKEYPKDEFFQMKNGVRSRCIECRKSAVYMSASVPFADHKFL